MKEIFALCGSTGVQNKVFFRRSLLIAVVFCFCIFPAVAQILPVVTVRFNNPRYACDNQTYRVDAEFRSDKPGLRLYSMNVRFCHETTALDYLGLGELAPGYTRYSPNPAQEEFWEGTPFGFPGTSAVTYINGAIQLADYTEDPILLPTGNGEWVKLFSIFFKVMDPGIIANGFCPVLIWDLQEVNSNGGFKIGSDGVTITCLDPPLYYIDGEPIYEQSKPVTEMAVQFNWIYDNDGNPATYGYPVPSVCIYGDTNPPVVSESDGSSKVECLDDIVEPEYPFASDNCSEQLTPVLESIIDTPDPLSCEGTRVYTYKYTGSTGLTAYWKYTYHILRTTPPRESGGPALTAAAVQCQDDALTPQLPEIRDVCGTILKAPEPVVTHSGGEYGGTITYDYVYIDCAGLEYPWRFTYTVMDDQPPTASNPADIVLTGCNSTFPAPDPLVVTDEADNCGVPVVAWVSDGPPVTEGCTETVIRTYSVTDGCNNKIRVTQKLIRMVDTQAPTASNPADIVLTGCNSTFPAPDPLVVTDEADNCGVPVVAWVSDGPPVTEGCTETIIRTYSVTDGCNNLIRVTQKLIRIVDGEDPVIPCPADVVLWVSAGETSTTWTPVIPEAFDNCTASATLTVTGVRSDGKPLIDPWPLGTTIITWNTEDGCGNSAVSCLQKVTVTVGEGCLTLVAKVFLEGALIDPVTSTEYATVMRTTLNDLQMLPGQAYDNGGTIIQTPAGQPYNTAPWFYDGQEGMFFDAGGTAGNAGYPAEVVDWVLVSLRNTAGAGYQKICEKAALLLSDGTIRMVEGFDCC
ncbi:MAG: HYR domain-containing protein, partial [Prolixibacteraceae bacterium]